MSMSNPGGPFTLFDAGVASGQSSANTASRTSHLGLRQRRSATANTAAGGSENVNPNNNNSASRDRDDDGGVRFRQKWDSMNAVPAPPRASLTNAGLKQTLSGAATWQRQPAQDGPRGESQTALVPMEGAEEGDLSTWVVGYGYRDKAQFRALYSRLESFGKIVDRRGGLSCFGEDGFDGDADGRNWVAVRYSSALCAQKALCQRDVFVTIGLRTMVFGLISLSESDAAARLGIDVGGPAREGLVLTRANVSTKIHRGLSAEADIMLCDGGGRMVGDRDQSALDSFCGKVLAWFFTWDV